LYTIRCYAARSYTILFFDCASCKANKYCAAVLEVNTASAYT